MGGMPELEETELPGLGVRHDFACRSGERVGVVSRHGGRRELVLYDRRDPDAVAASVTLTPDESGALADLLGGSSITARVAHRQQRVEGLAIDWLEIEPGSPFAGRTIADAEVRTRTGVSIVAVLRDGTAVPSPPPDFRFLTGDVAVVVGTAAGIEAAAALLGAG